VTFENLTADADALREQLGYERWAVLGHSFGGPADDELAFNPGHCPSPALGCAFIRPSRARRR
jgi:pimeloyl-ACP methyl ester carboxylesterase